MYKILVTDGGYSHSLGIIRSLNKCGHLVDCIGHPLCLSAFSRSLNKVAYKQAYFKPEYMNKQSKDIKYLKLDWRNKSKDWTYGFTTRSTNKQLNEYATFFSAGMSKQRVVGKWDITFSFDGYLPPKDDGSLDENLFEFENKFNFKYKLTERTSLYNIGEFYSLQGQKFYKAKVGLEFKL